MSGDLREQIYARISQARDDAYMDCRGMVPFRAAMMSAVDDLIALFAERERELRARIEALRPEPGHKKVDPDGTCVRCIEKHTIDDVLAEFDEAVSDGE